MSTHELKEYGPMRYPGGKDGMFQVYCTCGYSSGPYATLQAAYKPAKIHKKDKEAGEKNQETERLAHDYREMVTWWLDSPTMHSKRPDLVEKLVEGEEVTLTYEDLYWITATVRVNSKPR